MFKKFSTLLFVLMASISSEAMAGKDVPVELDGKKIIFTDIDHIVFSTKKKFYTDKDAAAIFVAPLGKNIQRLVRERLELAGLHTVDDPKNATMSINIQNVVGSLSLENIDQAAEHSATNKQQIISNILPAAGAAVIAGPAGAAAWVTGLFLDRSAKLIITVFYPGDWANDSAVFDYQLEKGNEANDETIFKAMVDQWIKLYIVISDKIPASAKETNTAS